MDTNTQRPVKRTYGKPRNAQVPAEATAQEEHVPETVNDVANETQEDVTAPSSPLDEGAFEGSPKTWDGLRRGAGADWRKVMAAENSDDDDDDDDGPNTADDVLSRARRAIMHEPAPAPAPASSSLPPLTSTDPLALSDGAEAAWRGEEEEEEETVPLKPRKRTIKASSPRSSTSSSSSEENEHATTPRGMRTPSTLRKATPETRPLPSSQPEYQRLLDAAQENAERRRWERDPRAQRRAAAAAVVVAVETSDAEREPRDVERDGAHGLQSTPASPSVRREPGPRRRWRRVVAASSSESDAVIPQKEPTKKIKPARESGDSSESEEEEGESGFKKTMGRIFERSKKPVSGEAEPAVSLPEENGRRTRRKAVREDLPSEDSEDEAPRKPSVRVSFLFHTLSM